MLLLRHSGMSRPYFWEFDLIKDELHGTFSKDLSYDTFFGQRGDTAQSIARYISLLVKLAKGRPVFVCCRTFARVSLLREEIGGTHVFLWRNP